MTKPSVPAIRRMLRNAVRDAKADGIALVYMGPLRYTDPVTGESCADIIGAVVGDEPIETSAFAAMMRAEERLGLESMTCVIADWISEGFDGNRPDNKWLRLGREFRAGAIDYADWVATVRDRKKKPAAAKKSRRKPRKHR